MANSTRLAVRPKPTKQNKLHKNFPLTAHKNRQFCKKVRGKIHYFGTVNDPQAALNEWLRVKDDLLAGREPRPAEGDFTIADICNAFLEYCDEKVDNEDEGQRSLSLRSFNDYKAACEVITKVFGRNRSADDIRPIDFQKLRSHLAKGRRPKTIENWIARCKVVFNFANANELTTKPIKYGKYFDKPPARVIRNDRKRQSHRGNMDLQSNQIRDVLRIACPQLKAMALLATNTGIGNADLGRMTIYDIDLDGGWLDYPRHKTGIERRAKLWPETVDAINAVLELRKEPKNKSLSDVVFLTRIGQSWYKEDSTTNPISQAFRKLLKQSGHYVKGVGFYGLRRTFETVAAETKDQPAIDLSMGHESADMAALYRQRLGDDRLEAVASHVHNWLFGSEVAK